jgi:hypothetical protein
VEDIARFRKERDGRDFITQIYLREFSPGSHMFWWRPFKTEILHLRKGESNMRRTLELLTSLAVLLVMTAATVHAQTEVIDIPFNFIIGNRILPAGEYVARCNRTNSDTIWLLQSKDGDLSAVFSTTAVQARKTQNRTKLIFNKYGSQHFLSQIWITGNNSGRELVMRRQERELRKTVVARQLVLSIGVAAKD